MPIIKPLPILIKAVPITTKIAFLGAMYPEPNNINNPTTTKNVAKGKTFSRDNHFAILGKISNPIISTKPTPLYSWNSPLDSVT